MVVIFYGINTAITLEKAQGKILSSNGKYFILISKKNSKMSFGSGKNEIRLYTSYYWLLGKCIYGEFPIKIIGWDLLTKEIQIEILEHRIENMPYILQFINKNDYLGDFKLIYQLPRVNLFSEFGACHPCVTFGLE